MRQNGELGCSTNVWLKEPAQEEIECSAVEILSSLSCPKPQLEPWASSLKQESTQGCNFTIPPEGISQLGLGFPYPGQLPSLFFHLGGMHFWLLPHQILAPEISTSPSFKLQETRKFATMWNLHLRDIRNHFASGEGGKKRKAKMLWSHGQPLF